MKYGLYILLLALLIPFVALGQSLSPDQQRYEDAYLELDSMLNRSKPTHFKRAVFITEDAYERGQLSEAAYEANIRFLSEMALAHAKANETHFIYEGNDRQTVLTRASVFRVMTDTLSIRLPDARISEHTPYNYDFDDFMGVANWRNMFVTKLLDTKKGNCHSLPYLYKIISEELSVSAHLALAPNHVYIKHHCEQDGWYNTELTSQCFPIDAWLMASGYIHLNAIQNGLYLDTLSTNQSLALCSVDLAMGYQRLYGSPDQTFPMKCVDRALSVFPQYTNALLLKSELLKNRMDRIAKENGASSVNEVMHLQKVAESFAEIEAITIQLYRWGYRKMPEKMYTKWLADLQNNKAKYANTHLTKNLITTN